MTDHNDTHDEGRDDASVEQHVIRQAGELLRDAVPPADFAAGFADRTMARLAAARSVTPPSVLRVAAIQRSFRMLAAAAALAIVALGVHNTLIARVADTTFVEAAIGLQPVSAESILSYTSEALQ
jgi:hypothetical protein